MCSLVAFWGVCGSRGVTLPAADMLRNGSEFSMLVYGPTLITTG
jgi:hypothetical protein